MIFVAAGGVLVAASGLAYWIFMSPYSQLSGDFHYKGTESERVVALTFDDGPNEPFTSQIADLLHSRGVRATFFQVGLCVERNPEVTLRLIREGHLIGGHSYTHRFRHLLRWSTQREDIEQGQQRLTTLLGRQPALFRPPWLFRHSSMLRTLRSQGIEPISGEFAHILEVFQPRPERIARRALAKVRPGAILIFHDGFNSRTGPRGRTVEALKLVVDRLLRDGWSFATVDELLGIVGYHSLEKSELD